MLKKQMNEVQLEEEVTRVDDLIINHPMYSSHSSDNSAFNFEELSKFSTFPSSMSSDVPYESNTMDI